MTGGSSGTLGVAKFYSSLTFYAVQTLDNTLSDSLPSVTTPSSDDVMRVYTTASGKLYETK